jgi:hypothetical protein
MRHGCTSLLLLALLTPACDHPNPSCERAVKHVFDLTTDGPPGSEPKGEEKQAIEMIRSQTVDRCTSEGISDAQLACILAAKSLFERTFLMCPALVAKKPSWIIAPIGHPEVLDELQHMGSATTP